jgi:hypothetical protein
MTIACPWCGRWVRIRKDGLLPRHTFPPSKGWSRTVHRKAWDWDICRLSLTPSTPQPSPATTTESR